MGGHTGVDFLYWFRETKKVTSIPVVMLSGSSGIRHVTECHAAGANFFISKAEDLERLKQIVRTLHLSFVTLKPPNPILLLKEYQPDPRDNARKTMVAVRT